MIELSGIDGKDIEFLGFNIETGIGTVKDKKNDITYKGRVTSFRVDSDFRHSFSGEVSDIVYDLMISLDGYEVLG